MMIKLLRKVPLVNRLFPETQAPPFKDHSLFVPSYDEATQRIAEWSKEWQIPEISHFHGENASYQNAVSRLNSRFELNSIIAFVGHGSPYELRTDSKIGKPSTSLFHGCLMNCEDLSEQISGIHIVAWACSSGKIFGEKVGTCQKSVFIGFKNEIVMVFNHPESESLWSNLIEELIVRIINKNRIEQQDKQWLKDRISTIRKDIKTGKINTGKYNKANLLFLKRIAKSVDVHGGI